MTSTFNLHKTITFVLNAIIMGRSYFLIKTNSEKSPIIFIVFYPALIILNLIIAFIPGLLKLTQTKIYRQRVNGLLVLLIPLVLIISQF